MLLETRLPFMLARAPRPEHRGGTPANHELIERVLELWAQGWSAGVIARELGTTRNSVLGRVFRAYRRGEAERRIARPTSGPKTLRDSGRRKLPKLRLVVIEPIEYPSPKPDPVLPLAYMAFGDTGERWHHPAGCAWIGNDTGPGKWPQFCNRPKWHDKTAWCAAHYRMVYQPAVR